MRSSGVDAAAARTSSAFLNDTMPLNDRYAPSASARRASSGPPVKQWNTVRSGTPTSASTRNVSSHASRVVDHEREAEAVRERDLRAERDLLLGARRVVVVEVEAGLPDADHAVGCAASADELVPLGRELRRVVRVQPDGGARRRRAGRRPRSTPRDDSRSVPTHTTPIDPGGPGPFERRPSAPSRSSDGRWQWLSTHRSRLDARETAVRPCRASTPRAGSPQPAASGSRSSVGSPRQPEASPQLRRRARDQRRRSSATTRNASRQSPSTAAVAAVSPALFSAHGCRSSMYEFASPMRSHTAPKPFE